VPVGTQVLSSGLGGVYPKGIPVGTVTGIDREQAGWERVYRLLPAANPGSAAHVLVLVASSSDLARAFPSDSALRAQRADSLERLRVADSVALAAREAKARRTDSLAAIRRDPAAVRPTRVAPPDTAARRNGPAPAAPKPAPAPAPRAAGPPATPDSTR
jgi:hypothetical protein